MIRTIKAFDLKDRNVLMRVDFNVPLKGKRVVDNFRILATLPSLSYILDSGASVTLMSHLGRPKGVKNEDLSLMPVGEELAGMLEIPIKFSHECVSQDALDTSLSLKPGEVHLLENLRFQNQETSNDPEFSKQLSKHGSIFINDAFGLAHRAHASNYGVAKHFKHKGMGFLIEKEIQYLDKIMRKPDRPLALILGGAKIDTKLDLITTFLDKADIILIGGGMSFTFLKAKGKEVGNSLVDEKMIPTAKTIIQKAREKGVKLLIPNDVVCGSNLKDEEPKGPFSIEEIPEDLMGLDIGPKTEELFMNTLNKAETVIWNGPVGVFELPGFHRGTEKIANHLSGFKLKGKKIIIGGGDTAAAISKFGLVETMSHVSTGGGSSLAMLTGKPLVGLKNLEV